MKTPTLSVLIIGLSFAFSTDSMAAISTWDTSNSGAVNCDPYNAGSSNCTSPNPDLPGFGNSRTYSASGTAVAITATAWSNTYGTNSTADKDSKLESAYLAEWGTNGLGVMNRDDNTAGDPGEGYVEAPEHAVDNQQRLDSVLFSFSGAANGVALTSVVTGWVGGCTSTNSACGGVYTTPDSDISVWAWQGGSAPATLGSAYSYNALQTGWTLVGHYDGGSSTGTININKTNISSSYWLIGAYAPVSGTCYNRDGSGNTGTCDKNDDYLKIASVGGTVTPGVPEPATLGLLGLGLLGMTQMRRMRKTS